MNSNIQIEEFEQVVKEVLKDLPEKFRNILQKEKIEILSREKVPRSVREKFPKRIIFGVFIGVSRKNKSVLFVPPEPTRIELYKECFEKVFGARMTIAMKERIAQTVMHEIAHYFGFNEEEIAERGY